MKILGKSGLGRSLVLLLSLWIGVQSKKQCSATKLCPDAMPCCSKYGYCGRGASYCAPEICVSGCEHPNATQGGAGKGMLAVDGADEMAEIDMYDLVRLKSHTIHSQCLDPTHVAFTLDDGIFPYLQSFIF